MFLILRYICIMQVISLILNFILTIIPHVQRHCVPCWRGIDFKMCDRELGAGITASTWVGIQNEKESANAAKIPPKAWYEMYVKPWNPWSEFMFSLELALIGNSEFMFSLKSFQRSRAREIGLLTGTATSRSTQTAKWWIVLEVLKR